jgi:hypothetical protein
MSDKDLVIWTIYDNPKDAPDQHVLRKWIVTAQGARPTDTVFVRPTLDAVRACLPTGLTCIPRYDTDEPQIVETWL